MIRETTFGKIAPGGLFGLSPGIFECGMEYMNVKMEKFGILCDENGEVDNRYGPFNVIALNGGRMRTFRDEERVYIEDGTP